MAGGAGDRGAQRLTAPDAETRALLPVSRGAAAPIPGIDFLPFRQERNGQACVPHSPLTPGGISREIIRNFMEVWK